MKYTVNKNESSFKEALLLWNRRMPNVCVNDIKNRLTKPYKYTNFYGDFVATEYNVLFDNPKETITVKF
jgi:hypothetical protein